MLKWRCVSTHFYFIISNEGSPSFSWFILVEIVMEDIDFIRIFVVILKILSMSFDFGSLLEGINKKNIRAWEEFYAKYYSVLCSYVNGIIRDKDQAQDIVQEVLVAVWKSSRQFQDMKELTSYLYRACYNNALIYLRNLQIRKGIERKIVLETEEEFSDEVFASTVRDELLRQLYNYIKELPEGAGEIMELSIQGFTGPEIAKKLGITIHTVKTQKSRSFKFLREKLKDSVLLYLL